jgi:HlyD family secretion protein
MTVSTEQLRKAGTTAQPGSEPVAPSPIPKRAKKKRRTGLIFALIGILLVALLAFAIISGRKTQTIAVDVEPVTSHSIVQTVIATGVIQPETQVKISPEVSGEIIYLGVKEGDHVQKGQVLVRINPEAAVALRDQQQAALAGARARLAQAQANMLRARQELSRMEQLSSKNLATAQELETAQTQVKVNEAEQQAAQYQVQQNIAALRQNTVSVSKTTITSPISGVVTKLNSKLGEKVVGAIQMTGTEIMTIADLSVIESVVDVSETDVVQVHMGDAAEVEVDAIQNTKYKAVVSQISNSPKQNGVGTQEQLTNFEVHLRFVDPDERFRPGMTATATIQTARKENVLAVPIQSVTTRQKEPEWKKKEEGEEKEVKNVKLEKVQDEKPQPIVFIRQGDSVVTRNVQTGIRDDRYIEIASGLKPGEMVVSGSYKAISKDLENGSKISIESKAKESRNDKQGGK